MPVRIVLDHPQRHVARRLWRRATVLIGAVLIVAGMAASVVAIPSSFLVLGWVLDEDVEFEIQRGRNLTANEILLAWAISTPLAVIGLKRGFWLVRRGRTFVLFLRRFGHDEAMSAVTFAVTRTIGSSWRVVTLDDAEIAPVGVVAGARRFFGTVSLTSTILSRTLNVLLRIFPTAQLGLWIVVAIDLARSRIWEHASDPNAWLSVLEPYFAILFTALEGRLPFDAIAPSLHGVFAAMMIVLAGIVLALGTALAAAPVAWGVGVLFLFVFSFSVDDVRAAERSKTRDIRTAAEVDLAVLEIGRGSRKVFGPRLVVLRVASHVWQYTVTRFAAVCAVSIVDVSEPTRHLVWEIEQLTRAQSRRIFIGHHERVLRLDAAGNAADLDIRRVADLLEWEEILAYTTDRAGMKRFARALRNTLLSQSLELPAGVRASIAGR
jgi:hypothetical protein